MGTTQSKTLVPDLYYEFIEDGNVLLEGMLDLNQSTIYFDVDSIDSSLYTFNIFSDSTNIKSIEFILSNPLFGDINADSIIDILDIMLCVNFIMEFIISDNYQSYISDINGDNLIDILDILNLVNIVISNNE